MRESVEAGQLLHAGKHAKLQMTYYSCCCGSRVTLSVCGNWHATWKAVEDASIGQPFAAVSSCEATATALPYYLMYLAC